MKILTPFTTVADRIVNNNFQRIRDWSAQVANAELSLRNDVDELIALVEDLDERLSLLEEPRE